MDRTQPLKLQSPITVNGLIITHVVIGRHYREKHAAYMTDELVLELTHSLDGRSFVTDSTSRGIEYYAADIELASPDAKIYRLVWLFEGTCMEVIGVINAYRIKKSKK